MTIKERLKLMKEVEERNRKRIMEFLGKAQKARLSETQEKPEVHRGNRKKRK